MFESSLNHFRLFRISWNSWWDSFERWLEWLEIQTLESILESNVKQNLCLFFKKCFIIFYDLTCDFQLIHSGWFSQASCLKQPRPTARTATRLNGSRWIDKVASVSFWKEDFIRPLNKHLNKRRWNVQNHSPYESTNGFKLKLQIERPHGELIIFLIY